MRAQRVLAVAVVVLFLVGLGFGQTRGRTEHVEAWPAVGSWEDGPLLSKCYALLKVLRAILQIGRLTAES